MATQVTYVGDGATVTYAIPFDYSTDGSDLNATVDTVPVSFTLDNASTLRLSTAPSAGSAVRIFRRTPFENLDVVFADSSILSADDLNNANGQLFRRVQEVADEGMQVSARALMAPEGHRGSSEAATVALRHLVRIIRRLGRERHSACTRKWGAGPRHYRRCRRAARLGNGWHMGASTCSLTVSQRGY